LIAICVIDDDDGEMMTFLMAIHSMVWREPPNGWPISRLLMVVLEREGVGMR
jgi:hypothetical protein